MRTQTRFLIILAVLAIGGSALLAQRSEGRHRATGGNPLQPDGTTQIESLAGTVDQTAITGNRPISQPVTVTNFPDPQQVAGTVNVGNLPMDSSGRVLVSGQLTTSTSALVLYSTATLYQGDLDGRTGATQKCQAEFPGSHFVHRGEIEAAYAYGRGIVWLTSETLPSWVDDSVLTLSCNEWLAAAGPSGERVNGQLVRAKGTDLFNGGDCFDLFPLLCAN